MQREADYHCLDDHIFDAVKREMKRARQTVITCWILGQDLLSKAECDNHHFDSILKGRPSLYLRNYANIDACGSLDPAEHRMPALHGKTERAFG